MRKLLLTVLTLALILGSISVASAASGKVKLTDIADNANEEAIQVSYDLGIVEGTPAGAYEPEKAVNRAEFAALIVRALAIPDSALTSYNSTTFKDTAGYTWAVPYLAVLQQKGIMKGDGYGNAMPSRTITPNEAVTMVLRAIGYTDNASVLVGQWPANYVSLGQSLNLYEKVSNDLQMNKASAAQMIYNVLTKQLVQVNADSTVLFLYDSDAEGRWKTLLTTGLNCSSEGLDVVTYGDAKSSLINLVPKVGAYGILYRSNVGNKEVVALTEVETVFLTGKFTYSDETAANLTGLGKLNKFKTVDGTEYNLDDKAKRVVNTITSYPGITASNEVFRTFFNGDDGGSVAGYISRYKGFLKDQDILDYKAANAGKSPAGNAAKVVIAAKVSGVTVLELRSVAVWDADVNGDTFLYESGQIEEKKFNGYDFPLDVNNERDDYGYVLNGVNSLDDIAADNVIYIYRNSDKKIARIDVGAETQSGVITNVNTADKKRTIGGKVLEDSPYTHATQSDLKINNEGTALLDVYGRTYGFRLGEASKGNFAMFIADDMSYDTVTAKIFDKTGNEVVYTAKDAVVNNGHLAYSSGGSRVWGDNLIGYKLSGGKLAEVNAARTAPTAKEAGSVNKAGTILKVNVGSYPGDYLIDSSIVVYVKNDTADYSIGSIKDLLDGDLNEAFQFFFDTESKTVKALMVDSSDAGAQNVYVMIDSITVGSDGKGGEIDVVSGRSFANGTAAASTWDYEDNTLVGTGPKAITTGRGRFEQMVKFRIGEDGVLKARSLELYTPTSLASGDKYDYDPIIGATYQSYNAAGGAFTLTVTHAAIQKYFTFEPDTVLYKHDGSSWAAYKPDEGKFKADEGNGVYTFLKTDPEKKAYDVIIKTN